MSVRDPDAALNRLDAAMRTYLAEAGWVVSASGGRWEHPIARALGSSVFYPTLDALSMQIRMDRETSPFGRWE